MIYVGIDVASRKHDCYMMSDNKNDTLRITFQNNGFGFKKIIDSINDFSKKTGDDKIRIGLESTGIYSHNILQHLVKNGYNTMLINPLLTNMERKSSSVRKTKTDKIDAKSICMFLVRNQDFRPYTIESYHNLSLKSLSRRRISLVKLLTKEKLQLNALITVMFPEYLGVFCSLYGNASLEVLLKYSTPDKIARARIDTLSRLIHKASKGHHGHDTAMKIKTLAKATIGDSRNLFDFEVIFLIQRIRLLQSQIKEYTLAIKKMMIEHCPQILTVPGIGYVTGAIIIGEIGDISRFNSPDQLLAFAGLDPCVYQSGNYNADNVSISKRGSRYLRWAMHIVSSIIIYNDFNFNAYYTKKREEGKHHFVALGHVSKKLIRVIFSLLKYDKSYISQT